MSNRKKRVLMKGERISTALNIIQSFPNLPLSLSPDSEENYQMMFQNHYSDNRASAFSAKAFDFFILTAASAAPPILMRT